MFNSLRLAVTGRGGVACAGALTTACSYHLYRGQLNTNADLQQKILSKDAELTRVAQEGQQLRVQLATAYERQQEQDRLTEIQKDLKTVKGDTGILLGLSLMMAGGAASLMAAALNTKMSLTFFRSPW